MARDEQKPDHELTRAKCAARDKKRLVDAYNELDIFGKAWRDRSQEAYATAVLRAYRKAKGSLVPGHIVASAVWARLIGWDVEMDGPVDKIEVESRGGDVLLGFARALMLLEAQSQFRFLADASGVDGDPDAVLSALGVDS